MVTAFSNLIRWKRFSQNKNTTEFKNWAFWILIGLGCLGEAGQKRSTKKTMGSTNQSNFQFWLDWDVWEEPAEKVQPTKSIQWQNWDHRFQCWFGRKHPTKLNTFFQFWLECWSRSETSNQLYKWQFFHVDLEWLDPVAKIEPKKHQMGQMGSNHSQLISLRFKQKTIS